jgi:phosphotransferase system  glucose/maltose/N-acetylglucosamine-specific IIC component
MVRYETKARIRILTALLTVFSVYFYVTEMRTVAYLTLAIAYAIVHVFIMVIIKNDAESRGIEDVYVWVYAVAVPVINIIGLIAYVVSRRNENGR